MEAIHEGSMGYTRYINFRLFEIIALLCFIIINVIW